MAYRDWVKTTDPGATVMRFIGSNWQLVGCIGFSGGDSPELSLALDGSGLPYVACRDEVHGYGAKAMRLAP